MSLMSDVVVSVGLLLTEVLEKAARQCGERDHTLAHLLFVCVLNLSKFRVQARCCRTTRPC